MTSDPLNWSFSFNQSVIPSENSDIYQLLHGFEKNTWTSFDDLRSKLNENADAILHIESIVKEWSAKYNYQQLSSPLMESITMDNLQSINDKCDAVMKILQVDSNVKKHLEDDLNSENNITQQLGDQFMKIIEDDAETKSTSKVLNELNLLNEKELTKLNDSIADMQRILSSFTNDNGDHVMVARIEKKAEKCSETS